LAFRQWAQQQSKATGRNVANDVYDYDLRGWWAQNQGAALSGGGHLTDQFKKPNHPTFSDQSQYHGVNGMQGGQWQTQPNGSYSFTPGPTNLYSAPDMQDYFSRVEKGNTLNMPQSALPSGQGQVASNDTNPKGNLGPDPTTDPPPTDEIEEWQQQQHNSPDAPLGPHNDRGVDPVLGWPNQTRLT
jgi:hypothetical protein